MEKLTKAELIVKFQTAMIHHEETREKAKDLETKIGILRQEVPELASQLKSARAALEFIANNTANFPDPLPGYDPSRPSGMAPSMDPTPIPNGAMIAWAVARQWIDANQPKDRADSSAYSSSRKW